MPQPPDRPEVTLTRSSAAMTPTEPAPARRPVSGLLLLAVVGVLLLLVVGRGSTSTSAPDPTVDAQLVLEADSLSVTQGGVLVVPVELRNPGPALVVGSASVYAEPVLDDPVVQAPQTVAAQADRRFVALLAPDCRLLRPGSPIEFRATVMLRLVLGPTSRDVMVDLGAAPAIRERVAGLCTR